MNVTIFYNKDGSIEIQTLDGNFHFNIVKGEFDISEPIDPVTLIKNIWSNAKIKDSSLVIEVNHL